MYKPQEKKSYDNPYRHYCKSCGELRTKDQFGYKQLARGVQRCKRCVWEYNESRKAARLRDQALAEKFLEEENEFVEMPEEEGEPPIFFPIPE